MSALLEWFAANFVAPLAINIIVGVLERRETDPLFRKRSDDAFGRLLAASSKEERKASAKELQQLVNS